MSGGPAHEPIDLLHLGTPNVIASFVVETDDGLALFDCGPSSCTGALLDGLAGRGLALQDIDHLLLSHIHLDHAGAAGTLVRAHPALRVHVSEVGAPHLVDPTRLEASARRLYGEAFDTTWGELAPVPAANVSVVGDDVLGLECFATPGHAWHHVSYLHDDGTLYTGDSVGVRLPEAEFVLAPTPPPEIDLEAWEHSLRETERRAPQRLAIVHFGVFADAQSHIARFRDTLARWSERVAHGMDEETFVAAARADCAASDPDLASAYDRAAPYWHCYRGLERYWRKRNTATSREAEPTPSALPHE